GREHVFTLEHGGESFAGNEFHDEEGAAFFFAVVEHVRDALVIDQGSVACLSTETFEEVRIAEVLVLEDLDGDTATDDEVSGVPHFAHATDGYTGFELVAPPEGDPCCGSHLFSTASMTFLAMGAATMLPEL